MKSISVCVGQPTNGQVTAGSARSFWRASSGTVMLSGHECKIEQECFYTESSLLALNFNLLWCWALNRVKEGKPVDYFAMIHGDIEAEDHWVDKMIVEMEENKLDVLGAVVPIKDLKGITSIALEKPDGDTWEPLCRLTMREVYELPETFTEADTGHPVLLNTGLWVAKFGDWADKVHFTINDRIVFSKDQNKYMPQVEPEDWYFARLLNELKLKTAATRKVAVEHKGDASYPNTCVWGSQVFDRDYVKKSVIKGDGFDFPYDVDGWLRPEEGRALAAIAENKRVLEIGSYCGLSTICLARSAVAVDSIDPHDGRGTGAPKDTYNECQNNLKRYGVVDKVNLYRSAAELNGNGPYDLVFIDGAHDKKSVRNDIDLAIDKLAPGGLLAFHDYRSDGMYDPEVKEAVDEFISDGAELLQHVSTVAVVKPPELKPQEA